MKSFLIINGIISMLILFEACGGPEISSFNAESHNSGKSCIECHDDVKVCGTVYDNTKTQPVSNVVVKLSTTKDEKGIVKASFEADQNGNFYFNKDIEVKGLYTFVSYPDGSRPKYMQTPINTGDCNSCHKEGNRIWIE